MPTPAQRKQRRQALTAARTAVRAYARDPSPANASNVAHAWRRVREIDSVARWRLPVGVIFPAKWAAKQP